MTHVMDDERSLEEILNEDEPDHDELPVDLSPTDAKFVHDIVERCITFGEEFCGFNLFPYQREFSYRLFESIIIGDGEEITALFSRQSGKTQTTALVVSTAMLLFPRLAKIYPEHFGKFSDGLMVGVFGPTDDQADLVFSRIVGYLTSDRATEIMLDPEIDEKPDGRSKIIKLRKSGSFCRRQTANPRAKIEGSSYHVICIDEAQDADEQTVRKSIHPMGAFYNATIVKTGTPNRTKGDFYKAIGHNRRRETRTRRNHFEFDWRYCAKYNPNYASFVKKEMARLGEESDEFQMSYAIRWLLERGMFVTSTKMDELGDRSMQVVKQWWRTPCVAGIDPARSVDSTVVTVCWVDWDSPDEYGFYEHRPLNWLEIHGDDWESQYYQIIEFLSDYSLYAVGVDAQGIGDAVANRLQVLMPAVRVIPMLSTAPEQSKRWKNLLQLIQRNKLVYPAHSKARRLRVWRRFYQQMTDLEKKYQGPHLMAAAPDEAGAHDDYPDSLALACACSIEETMPEVEVSSSPFYGGYARR